MTSFLAQVLYSVWTAWTMIPVPPLLPSEVSEILLTLCDHRPIHDPAPCCSSVIEQRDHGAGRVLPGHTHVIRLWLPGNSFTLVWLNLWFWKKNKKQKNRPHLVTLPLLTTILCYPPHCWAPLPSVLPPRTQHADTPPSSLTLISGTTVAHFLDPALWFPPSFLHITNCSTLDLNSFLPSSS